MKILVDTNIWLAAFRGHGICWDVVEYIVIEHEVCTSEFILSEVKKKLVSKKFSVSEKNAEAVCNFINKIALKAIYNKNDLPKICRDKSDNHILAAAESLKVDCILTGDKDLLVLKTYKGIKILSPSEFLKLEGKQV